VGLQKETEATNFMAASVMYACLWWYQPFDCCVVAGAAGLRLLVCALADGGDFMRSGVTPSISMRPPRFLNSAMSAAMPWRSSSLASMVDCAGLRAMRLLLAWRVDLEAYTKISINCNKNSKYRPKSGIVK
jgi:hypothetical protein